MSLAAEPVVFPTKRKPAHIDRVPRGKAFKLPDGLDEGIIFRVRRRAEKLETATGGSFVAIFAAKIFEALTERGLARLSAREIVSLAQIIHKDTPEELGLIIILFIAAHPPAVGDFPIMKEAIIRGALGGTDGLVELHKFISERQRKARSKVRERYPWLAIAEEARAAKQAKPRPILRPAAQRANERVMQEKQQHQQALAVLARLYPKREKLKPWMREFLECCEALTKSGYGLVPAHCKHLLEMAKEVAGH